MRHIVSILFMIVGLLLLSSVAFASSGVETASSALARIADAAYEILVPVIAIFATWLAHRAIRAFEKKTNIDVPTSIESRVDSWVDQAIVFAEERSRQKVLASAEKLKGPEKLELAVGYIDDLARSQGWVDWTRDLLRSKVEARVGAKRANGGKPTLDEIIDGASAGEKAEDGRVTRG